MLIFLLRNFKTTAYSALFLFKLTRFFYFSRNCSQNRVLSDNDITETTVMHRQHATLSCKPPLQTGASEASPIVVARAVDQWHH